VLLQPWRLLVLVCGAGVGGDATLLTVMLTLCRSAGEVGHRKMSQGLVTWRLAQQTLMTAEGECCCWGLSVVCHRSIAVCMHGGWVLLLGFRV
jgi:hypothetical protein